MSFTDLFFDDLRARHADGNLVGPDAPLVDAFITQMRRHIDDSGVAVSPFLLIRLEEILVLWLINRRMLDELCARTVFDQPEDTSQPDDTPQKPRKSSPLVETACKTQERMRKAMKELEELLAKAGIANDNGMPDALMKLIDDAKDAFEDALEPAQIHTKPPR